MNLRNKNGNESLYEKLKQVDPQSAAKMLPQNWKRIIRALEVYHITGKPITHFHSDQRKRDNYSFIQFGLDWESTITL